jgi:taurine dioxygenase
MSESSGMQDMPPSFRHITVAPIAGALGAEIGGVDLSAPLDDGVFAEIRAAFLRYGVVFFRDQDLTPEQHIRFARCFGPLSRIPFIKTMPEHPEIIAVIREADESTPFNFGGDWHSDLSFLETPPLASCLYAREVPPFGGDTQWSSLHRAYETLSNGMRALLDRMVVMHSAINSYNPDTGERKAAGVDKTVHRSIRIEVTEEARTEMPHPVVRTIRETGRRALFVNEPYALRFQGMTREESAPLIGFLNRHAVRPEFTCRFTWRRGSLALWDNRCCLHFAINDYRGYRRVMHRVTIAGERPFGPAMPAQDAAGAA